jgi:hypothetical protein
MAQRGFETSRLVPITHASSKNMTAPHPCPPTLLSHRDGLKAQQHCEVSAVRWQHSLSRTMLFHPLLPARRNHFRYTFWNSGIPAGRQSRPAGIVSQIPDCAAKVVALATGCPSGPSGLQGWVQSHRTTLIHSLLGACSCSNTCLEPYLEILGKEQAGGPNPTC